MNEIKKFLDSKKFGLMYMLDKFVVHIGLKKELTINSILKKQHYYEKLKKEEYPEELKKWYHVASYGKVCNLDNPCSFTEKIQWIKLHDTTEKKSRLADKYLVREWIKEKIGEEYLIPILGVWDDANDIDYNKLPDRFVLKCNHGAAMNIIVESKTSLNLKKINQKINNWLKMDYGLVNGSFELHYSGIKRKVIAEKFLKDGKSKDLMDYKFYCFNGKPHYCQVICDRTTKETIDFYDMEWRHQSFTGLSDFPNSQTLHKCPCNFEKMKELAEILSEEFCFVRVDFYEVNKRIYFGEMTFTPASGAGRFRPDYVDLEMGKLLKLPDLNNNIE